MPLYDFEDVDTGEAAEVFYMIADRPDLGAVIQHEGRKLRRVLIPPHLAPVRDFEFVSNALPRENVRNPKWPCDAKGRPRFRGKKDVAEYTARSEGKAAWDAFED